MTFQSPLPSLDDSAAPRAAGRRLRVVVAGEFKSGKSSVVNALLRQPVLPMQSRQASRPAFLVRHAPERAGTVLLHHGTGLTEPAGRLDDATDFGGAGLCEVLVAAPHLDGVELVELPFPCDGEVGAEALALMSGADLLIWVSIASQAWRLSEKAILSQLPPMRARSVIVLSRADKLRSAGDWDRIEERVQREAGPFFGAVAFVQASRETIRLSAADPGAWETSGGKILSDLIADRRRRMEQETAPKAEPKAEPKTGPGTGPNASGPSPGARPAAGTAPPFPAAAPPAAAPPATARPPEPVPPEKQEEMEQVAASLAGLACGGIAGLDSGACLAAFGPQREQAARLALAVREMWCAQAALEAATGTPAEESVLRLGSQRLIVARLTEAPELAFLLLRHERTNITLAQTALHRIAGIWSGAR